MNMEEKLVAVMINEAGFEYDIHSLVKAFYPECEVKVFVEGEKAYSSTEGLPDLSLTFSEDAILLGIVAVGEEKNSSAFCGMKIELKPGMERPEVKNALKQLIYTALSEHTGKELPWGTLTGIRPTKIPMQMLQEGKGEEEILAYLQETYYVSKEKGIQTEVLHHLHQTSKQTALQKEPLFPYTAYFLQGLPFPLPLRKINCKNECRRKHNNPFVRCFHPDTSHHPDKKSLSHPDIFPAYRHHIFCLVSLMPHLLKQQKITSYKPEAHIH